jgi:hypothetical protein
VGGLENEELVSGSQENVADRQSRLFDCRTIGGHFCTGLCCTIRWPREWGRLLGRARVSLLVVSLMGTVLLPASHSDARRAPGRSVFPRELAAVGQRCTIMGTAVQDHLIGTSKDDVICALGGFDAINAEDGDDVVFAGKGQDVVQGGAGSDRILLGRGRFEDARGGPGADEIRGGPAPDGLFGDRGSDRIYGGPGSDGLLDGGTGRDVIRGGPKQETCILANDGAPGDFVDAGRGVDFVFADPGDIVINAEADECLD